MAINFDKYKTYDTSSGYGDKKSWRRAFESRMGNEEAEIIIKESKETPYSILGISEHSSQVEIRLAFRKLISEWHPDKNSHRVDEATEMSKKIIAAYTILKTK